MRRSSGMWWRSNYPDLTTVRLAELEGAIGRVELAILRGSPNPDAAARFAHYFASSDRGLSFLRKSGFTHVADGKPWRGLAGRDSRIGSDRGFYLALAVLGGSYVLLIVGLLVADVVYTRPDQLRADAVRPAWSARRSD